MIRLARFLILLPLVVAAYVGKTAPTPNVIVALELPAHVSEPAFSEAEIKCAADMVYGEAGSEPFEGKVAAAAVAIRRSLKVQWQGTLCEVVRQTNQFYGYRKMRDAPFLAESKRSVLYAIEHLGQIPEALYFHRKEMKGQYASHYTIGNHTFYMRHSSADRRIRNSGQPSAGIGAAVAQGLHIEGGAASGGARDRAGRNADIPDSPNVRRQSISRG